MCSLFSPFPCDGFTCNQAAAQCRFNLCPADGRGSEVYQKPGNFSVFRSHFHSDRELSLGDSLSAWEKAPLPKRGGDGISVWRPEKESVGGRSATLFSRRSRASASVITTGDTVKCSSYKIGDQHLDSGSP